MKLKKITAFLLAFLLLAVPVSAEEERESVRIAVIDTGISTAAIASDRVEAGKNYIFPDRSTEDVAGHGTAVASIIVGSESAGIAGICPEAVLIPLVYIGVADNGEEIAGDLEHLAQAIRDAVDIYHCDIINVSSAAILSKSYLREAVEYAVEQGVMLVSVAGNLNDGYRRYPGGYEEAFCVGAVNEERTGAASFSNVHNYVDLIAPGVAVPVAAVDGTRTTMDGTSFSAAYISGVAAKLMTEYPELTAARVEEILIASAQDLDVPGWDSSTGWGVVDPEEALSYAETGQIFRDVSLTDWFFKEVNAAAQSGILNGTDEMNFAPYQATTRAMLWVMLYRSEGLSTSKNQKYWYSDAQEWMISTGISDGSDPEGSITREQMATILWRYAKYKGMDVSAGDESVFATYRDSANISSWAVDAMKWACGVGLINGSDGSLLPGSTADRAQTAVILMRFLKI